MDSFKALLIEERDGKASSAFVRMDEAQLDPGQVTIRVAYSSINFKDALAATGAGKIIRRFPCIGGIDLSGTVIASSDARFKIGDPVIATSFDIGVAHHGGYAEIARLPGDWVVPLPENLSLFDAMALGTAGFTAALGIVRMEENGLRPDKGPVIVTGATGGVGSLAIDMLAKIGYHVVALTGKESEAGYLRELGAAEVMLRQSLDLTKIRPLDRRAGRRGRQSGRRHPGLDCQHHGAGRHHRQHRPGGEHVPEYDGRPLHPARGFAARRGFWLYPRTLPARRLAAFGQRSAAAASGSDVPIHCVR